MDNLLYPTLVVGATSTPHPSLVVGATPTPHPSLVVGATLTKFTEKKVPKKVLLSLMVRPFAPPPLLMARPLREELFFRLPIHNNLSMPLFL